MIVERIAICGAVFLCRGSGLCGGGDATFYKTVVANKSFTRTNREGMEFMGMWQADASTALHTTYELRMGHFLANFRLPADCETLTMIRRSGERAGAMAVDVATVNTA